MSKGDQTCCPWRGVSCYSRDPWRISRHSPGPHCFRSVTSARTVQLSLSQELPNINPKLLLHSLLRIPLHWQIRQKCKKEKQNDCRRKNSLQKPPPPRKRVHLCRSRQRTLRFLGKAGRVLALAPLSSCGRQMCGAFDNQETPTQIVRENYLQMCHREKSQTIAHKLVKITFPQINLIFCSINYGARQSIQSKFPKVPQRQDTQNPGCSWPICALP